MKKIIAIATLLLILPVFLISCKNDEKSADNNITIKKYYVYETESFRENGAFLDSISVFDSKEELMEYCETTGNEIIHCEEALKSRLKEDIDTYDDDFFENKSVILILMTFSHPYKAKIDSVEINENEVNVRISRPVTQLFHDTEATYFFIIDVNKLEIENKRIRLEVIKKGEQEDY